MDNTVDFYDIKINTTHDWSHGEVKGVVLCKACGVKVVSTKTSSAGAEPVEISVNAPLTVSLDCPNKVSLRES